MNIQSPLTGKTDITWLKTIAADTLINDWNQTFKINISSELREYKEIHLYQCNKTKLKFFFPFDIAGSEKLYEQLQKIDWFYTPDKWEHKVALRNLSNCNDILEIGCAFGSFVESALKLGLNAQGIELNSSAVEVAKKNNLPVESIDLQEFAETYPLSQDAICSFQVLEHIPQPKNFIELCLRTLKPGGKLIFCVPNAESFLQYQYDLLDMPPHHMTQWKASTFKALENIFAVKLEKVIKEPLHYYHVDTYLHSYGNHICSISPLGKIIFNQYTIPLYGYFLKAGLRNLVTGHSLYVQFRKLDGQKSDLN
ncbi:class I SAM-dependent methyltransferase [Nostoc sp.]|uniref:class I SAM-dependent methyltransferase n=1 Tax=Nostoc sp. TaxID=1180 RepID=UPI002FF70327